MPPLALVEPAETAPPPNAPPSGLFGTVPAAHDDGVVNHVHKFAKGNSAGRPTHGPDVGTPTFTTIASTSVTHSHRSHPDTVRGTRRRSTELSTLDSP